MPHPSDYGSFGTLLDRDSFCPSDRAAANRRGMIGHGTGEALGEIGVLTMEGKESHH